MELINRARIRWVLEFVEMDLSTLNATKLTEVRKFLSIFLRHDTEEKTPGAFIAFSTDGGPLKLKLKQLEALQKDAKKIVTWVLESKRVGTLLAHSKNHPIRKKYGTSEWAKKVFLKPENLAAWRQGMSEADRELDISCKFQLLATPAHFAIDPIKFNHINILYRGKTRDVFLLKLIIVISQEYLGSIIRCASPVCNHRIFFRTGKQIYCSPRCSKIMTQRIWRESLVNRAREARAARERRAKKQSN